jgi:hypothetical protein
MKLLFSTFILLIRSFSIFAQSERAKGIELYEKGEYQQAIDTMRPISDKAPDLGLYTGMAYAKLKKDKEATEAFAEAVKNSIIEVANDSPAKVTKKPRPNYTDEGRTNNVQGKVKIAVELGADGEIKFIFPFQGMPHGLTRAAMTAVKNIDFEPAMRGGKPVSTIRIFEYGFSIY